MGNIQELYTTIDKLLNKFEAYPMDPTIPYFQSLLTKIREELSKPEISTAYLRGASGGLSRIIQESIWADTPLGDEILFFLLDLRKYRIELEASGDEKTNEQ